MAEPEQASFLKGFPDALTIAVITAAAYWFTFRYETGYLGSFGIPAQFVAVSFQTVLVVATGLTAGIVLLVLLFNLAGMFWPTHPALRDKVLRIVLMLLYPAWLLIATGLGPRTGSCM